MGTELYFVVLTVEGKPKVWCRMDPRAALRAYEKAEGRAMRARTRGKVADVKLARGEVDSWWVRLLLLWALG